MTVKHQRELSAEAQDIAARNPDWKWDGVHLTHLESGSLVRLSGYGTRWGAWNREGRLRGPGGKVSAFHSAANAIRALGLAIVVVSTGRSRQ
jgi:hypothetical protein